MLTIAGFRVIDWNNTNLSFTGLRAVVAVSLVLFWYRLADSPGVVTVYGEDYEGSMRKPIRDALRLFRGVLPSKWKDYR